MKNTSLLHSFLFLSLFAPTALAADAERLFGLLDHNRNAWIEADEIGDPYRRLFQRLLRTSDDDQDGRLSLAEFQVGLEPQTFTKPLVQKQSSELPGADALLLLLAKMDVNSNGRIEQDEVPAQFLAIFKRIEDRLGGEPDGVLDRRELTQAAPQFGNIALRIVERMDLDVDVELALLSEKQWRSVQNMIGPRSRGEMLANPQQAREFFRRLDTNNDGQIASSEVPAPLAERFEQLLERADRDRNNQISEQELMAVSRLLQAVAGKRPSPAQIQEGIDRLLKKWDRNGDQQISQQEAPRRLATRFERLDRDGNGQLDRGELVPAVELLSQLRRPEAEMQEGPEPKMQSE